MAEEAIDIPIGDGRALNAHLAVAEDGGGPGLVLVGAADDGARLPGALYAAEGYIALSVQSIERPDDIASAIAALRRRPETTGEVAAIGFGQGCLAVMDAAAKGRIECAICYSPSAGPELLARAVQVSCPIVAHISADGIETAAELRQAFAAAPQATVYLYPGTAVGFERDGAQCHKAAARLAHSRSIALLRRVIGPRFDLEALWEAHTRYEFETRDVDATMATMVADPYVNHVPVMTGGVGQRELARFYAHHFIPKCPADFALIPVSRTIGADRIVDEMVVSFIHDREIDWMLPGIPPTGRRVEIPVVAIVGFRGDKLYHEHIYWDQASVLVQIGLLDPKGLPVAGVETARKLLDETLPSNGLMTRWAESAPKDG